MPTQKSLSWDDLSGGERGRLPAWRSNRNTWTGRNVMALVDGSIAPRSGLRNLGKSGGGANPMLGMGWAGGGASSADKAWFVVGTSLYTFDPSATGGSIATVTGTLSATPTRIVEAFAEAGTVWLTNYNDRLYKLVLSTNTLTAISNTTTAGLAGRCVVGWNGFLITGGGSSNVNRIWWADGDDYGVWPSTPNFVAIGGADSAVVGLFVVRNQLVVAKDDGSWWVITGDLTTSTVPDSVYTVRQTYQAYTPLLEPQAAGIVAGQQVWHIGKGGPYPSWFNGSTISDLDYLNTDWTVAANPTSPLAPQLVASRLTAAGDVLLAAGAGGTDRLLYRNGAWSKHSFAVSGLEWTAAMTAGQVLMSDGGSAGVVPKFYVWQATGIERPPTTTGLENVLDDTTAYVSSFESSEEIADGDKAVTVRYLIVDFERYNQGTGAPRQSFEATIRAMRRPRPGDPERVSQVQSWSGENVKTGKARVVLAFGDQGRGSSYAVIFNNIRGVSINRFEVVTDDDGSRLR